MKLKISQVKSNKSSVANKQQPFKELANNTLRESVGSVNVVYWNVNGVRSITRRLKTGESKDFLTNFKKMFEENDIIFFAETKVSSEAQIEEVMTDLKRYIPLVHNFQHKWSFSTKRKGYAGVTVFWRIKVKSVKEIVLKCCPGEGRIIQVVTPNDIRIIGVYVMNSGGKLERLALRTGSWDTEFFSLCNEPQTLVIGDVNCAPEEIDVYNSKKCSKMAGHTKEERESYNKYFGNHFIDTFRYTHPDKREYTFWSTISNARSRNDGWRIDHALLNNIDLFKSVSHEYQFVESDHIPIKVKLKDSFLNG